MRTIEINVYKFSELSEDVQKKVAEKYASEEYGWSNEAVESIKKFIEYFNGKLKNYSIDFLEPYRNSFTIHLSECMEDLPEEELKNYIEGMGGYDTSTLRGHGECKFTGYCMDEALSYGARLAYFKGERDVKELIFAGISVWEKEVIDDYEQQFTVEYMADVAEANDWEFTEDGKIV